MIGKALVTVLLVLSVNAANAQAESPGSEATGSRPNAGGGPDKITVRLGLLDIPEINDREQVFIADIFFHIEWRDSRLAVDASAEGSAGVRTSALD